MLLAGYKVRHGKVQGGSQGPKTSSKWGQLDAEMTAVVCLDFKYPRVPKSRGWLQSM